MYEGWRITRWETPIADTRWLLLVSLVDTTKRLTLVLEAFRSPGRPRWEVSFSNHFAYRNIGEAYRLSLWASLSHTGQRWDSTFMVEEREPLSSWHTGYLHEVVPGVKHYVIATTEDVIEILSSTEPLWRQVAPPAPDEPLPGKIEHLFIGEDDARIAELAKDLKRRH